MMPSLVLNLHSLLMLLLWKRMKWVLDFVGCIELYCLALCCVSSFSSSLIQLFVWSPTFSCSILFVGRRCSDRITWTSYSWRVLSRLPVDDDDVLLLGSLMYRTVVGVLSSSCCLILYYLFSPAHNWMTDFSCSNLYASPMRWLRKACSSSSTDSSSRAVHVSCSDDKKTSTSTETD